MKRNTSEIDGTLSAKRTAWIPPMDLLPDHAIEEIMEYIAAPEIGITLDGLRSFVRFASTCRRMRDIARASPVWRAMKPADILCDIAHECDGRANGDAILRVRCGGFVADPRISACESLGTCSWYSIVEETALMGRMSSAKHACVTTTFDSVPKVMGMPSKEWMFDKAKKCTVAGVSLNMKTLETLKLRLTERPGCGPALALDLIRNPSGRGFSIDKITMCGCSLSMKLLDRNPGVTSLAFLCDTEKDWIPQILDRLPSLRDFRCTFSDADYIPTIRSKPMTTVRKLVVSGPKPSIFAIGEMPPSVMDHTSELCALFPGLEELDMSGNYCSPPGGGSSIASLGNLTALSLNMPDDPIAYVECMAELGNSDGAPLERLFISGGAGMSLEDLFRGKRCRALREVELDNRGFCAEEGSALPETLLKLRVRSRCALRPKYSLRCWDGLGAALERCGGLRELGLFQFDMTRVPRWPKVLPALRKVFVRIDKGEDCSALPRIARSFAYVTELEFDGALDDSCRFGGFVGACENVVRVTVGDRRPLRQLVSKRIEILVRRSVFNI